MPTRDQTGGCGAHSLEDSDEVMHGECLYSAAPALGQVWSFCSGSGVVILPWNCGNHDSVYQALGLHVCIIILDWKILLGLNIQAYEIVHPF